MKAVHCLINPSGQITDRVLFDPSNDEWNIDPGWRIDPESECAGLPDAPPPPPKLMPVTKLIIMRRLGDKWPDLKAVLKQMPETVQDAWDLAQEIDPNDGMFKEYRDALQAALGLQNDEFNALFAP